ncbi:MAG TPA: hypothetical protein IAC62_00765, partial [Candidatus Pelethocola excrementipullorum]|nr:hypothetical protein [Candidatus Pelethocola excrementipullorum]
MSQFEYYADGFDDFSKMLEEFSKKTEEENILKVLEYGAEEYAKDLRALPKPRSKIMTGGYTH